VVVAEHLLKVKGSKAVKGISVPKALEYTLKHPMISSGSTFICNGVPEQST
jgi:hypothetical protein